MCRSASVAARGAYAVGADRRRSWSPRWSSRWRCSTHTTTVRAGQARRQQHGGADLAASHAYAYNPDAQGSKWQENNAAKYAIDGNTGTAWTTEHYFGGVSSRQARRRHLRLDRQRPSAAKMVVDTTTKGFNAKIYATNTTPNPDSFTASNWVPIGGTDDVAASQHSS